MKGIAFTAGCLIAFAAGATIFFLSLSGLALDNEWDAALGLGLVISALLMLLAVILTPTHPD